MRGTQSRHDAAQLNYAAGEPTPSHHLVDPGRAQPRMSLQCLLEFTFIKACEVSLAKWVWQITMRTKPKPNDEMSKMMKADQIQAISDPSTGPNTL